MPPQPRDPTDIFVAPWKTQERIKRLDDLLTKWNELFDRSQIPEFLYHYTTFDGLQGILQENALRATFSQSLNDSTEWTYGKSVIKKYPIPEALKSELMAPPDWDLCPPKYMFVTCFCERDDLLSMWRSYTGQGGGYCLGFDGADVADLQRESLVVGDKAAWLVKVYYGERPTAKMESLLECSGHAYGEWLLENMIKHPGFEEEHEWRIIVPDPPVALMSFHSGHANIKASIPLKHLRTTTLPLKKLVYGPTLRNDTALRQTLEWMFEKHGFNDVEVVPCGIPYRL